MKLYETNKQLEELVMQLRPDEETGEMPENTDEIIEQIKNLQATKEEILNWIAREVLNARADHAAIKAEEERLHRTRQAKESLINRLISILDYECAGQNTDFGVCKLTHRKTTKTEVTDAEAAVNFLQRTGHDDALKYTEPEVNRTVAKDLIRHGVPVPGVELVDGISVSLR